MKIFQNILRKESNLERYIKLGLTDMGSGQNENEYENLPLYAEQN